MGDLIKVNTETTLWYATGRMDADGKIAFYVLRNVTEIVAEPFSTLAEAESFAAKWNGGQDERA